MKTLHDCNLFADRFPCEERNIVINILIGVRYYYDFVEPEHTLKLTDSLHLVWSKCGWLIVGTATPEFETERMHSEAL